MYSSRGLIQPITRRVVGLDLGKAVDYTALTLLEWTWPKSPTPPSALSGARPTYDVRSLKRWPLGTSYIDISAWLVKLFQSPEMAEANEPPPCLVVDETGVGGPVYEMIRRALGDAQLPGGIVGVTITAGSQETLSTASAGRWRVAKKRLASVLVTLFQGRRLNVAPVPDRELLIREAQAFSVKITPDGNETFESWREADHDDLVLSLALACWAAETLEFPAWPAEAPGPTRLRA